MWNPFRRRKPQAQTPSQANVQVQAAVVTQNTSAQTSEIEFPTARKVSTLEVSTSTQFEDRKPSDQNELNLTDAAVNTSTISFPVSSKVSKVYVSTSAQWEDDLSRPRQLSILPETAKVYVTDAAAQTSAVSIPPPDAASKSTRHSWSDKVGDWVRRKSSRLSATSPPLEREGYIHKLVQTSYMDISQKPELPQFDKATSTNGAELRLSDLQYGNNGQHSAMKSPPLKASSTLPTSATTDLEANSLKLDKPVVIFPADKPGLFFMPGITNLPMLAPFPIPPFFPPPSFPLPPLPPFGVQSIPLIQPLKQTHPTTSTSAHKEASSPMGSSQELPRTLHKRRGSLTKSLKSGRSKDAGEDSGADYSCLPSTDLFNTEESNSYIYKCHENHNPAESNDLYPGAELPTQNRTFICTKHKTPVKHKTLICSTKEKSCDCQNDTGTVNRPPCVHHIFPVSQACCPNCQCHYCCLPTNAVATSSCATGRTICNSSTMGCDVTQVNASMFRSIQVCLRNSNRKKNLKVKKYNFSSETIKMLGSLFSGARGSPLNCREIIDCGRRTECQCSDNGLLVDRTCSTLHQASTSASCSCGAASLKQKGPTSAIFKCSSFGRHIKQLLTKFDKDIANLPYRRTTECRADNDDCEKVDNSGSCAESKCCGNQDNGIKSSSGPFTCRRIDAGFTFCDDDMFRPQNCVGGYNGFIGNQGSCGYNTCGKKNMRDRVSCDNTCAQNRMCDRMNCDNTCAQNRMYDSMNCDNTCAQNRMCDSMNCDNTRAQNRMYNSMNCDNTRAKNRMFDSMNCDNTCAKNRMFDSMNCDNTCAKNRMCDSMNCDNTCAKNRMCDSMNYDNTCAKNRMCDSMNCDNTCAKNHMCDSMKYDNTCAQNCMCDSMNCDNMCAQKRMCDSMNCDNTCAKNRMCDSMNCDNRCAQNRMCDSMNCDNTCAQKRMCDNISSDKPSTYQNLIQCCGCGCECHRITENTCMVTNHSPKEVCCVYSQTDITLEKTNKHTSPADAADSTLFFEPIAHASSPTQEGSPTTGEEGTHTSTTAVEDETDTPPTATIVDMGTDFSKNDKNVENSKDSLKPAATDKKYQNSNVATNDQQQATENCVKQEGTPKTEIKSTDFQFLPTIEDNLCGKSCMLKKRYRDPRCHSARKRQPSSNDYHQTERENTCKYHMEFRTNDTKYISHENPVTDEKNAGISDDGKNCINEHYTFSKEEGDVPRPTDDQDQELKEKERDPEAGVKRTKKSKAAIQTSIAVTDCENESKIPRLSRVHRCKDCQHEHVDTSELSEKHLKETHANQQQGGHEHNNLKTSILCAMKRKSVKIKNADIKQESKNRHNGSDRYPKDDTISPCGVCSSQPSYKDAAKVVEPSEMNKPAEKHGERLKPCMNNDTVSSKVQDSADNIFGTQKSKCKNHTDGKLFRSTFSCKGNSHEESTTCDLPELDSEIDLQRQQDRIDDTPRFLHTQPNTNKESPHTNKALENTIPRNDNQQVKRNNTFACKIQRKRNEIKSSVNAGADINEDKHTTACLLGEYCRKKHNDSTSRGNFVEPTHIGNKQMKQHEREQEILNRSTTEGRNVVQSSTSSIDSKIESRTSQLPNAHRCQGCKNDEADFLTHHEPYLHKGYISNRNQPKITHEQEKSKVSIFCAMKKKLMKCKDVDNTWKCEGSRHDKRDNHKKDSRVKSPCRICRSRPSSSVKTASLESSDVDVTKETPSLESSDVVDVTKETASPESSDVDDVTKVTPEKVTPVTPKKKETSLTEVQLSSQVKETVGIIYAMSNSKFKDTTDCRLFGGTFGCKDNSQEESTACNLPDLDSKMSDTRGQQNIIQGLSEFFCSQTIKHKDYDNPSCYESESGPNCFSKCFPIRCQNSVLQCSCCPNLQGNNTNDRSDCSCTNLGHHLLVCRPCSRQFGHNHCLCRGTQQTNLKKPSNKCVDSDQCVAFQCCSLENCRFGCYFIVKSNSNNTKNSQNMTVSYLDSEEASLTKSRSSLNATRAEQVSLPRTDSTGYRHYFECADSEYKQQTLPTYRAYSGQTFHEFYPLNSSKMETSANVHSQGNEYSAKGERAEQGDRIITTRILIGSNRVRLCLERGCMHNSLRCANNVKESPQVHNSNLREPAQEKQSINSSDHTNSKKKEIGCTVNHISKRSQTDRGQTICNENNTNKHEVVITISNHGNQSHSEPNNNVSDHIEREVSNNVGLHSKPCKRELSNSISNESYSRRQELSNNVSQDSNPSTREQSCRISIDNSRSDRELSATVINDNIQKEKELHSSASNVSDAYKKELKNTASNDTNITKRELSNIMCNSTQRTEREASTIPSNYRNRKRKENVNSPSNYCIIDNRDLKDTVTNKKNEKNCIKKHYTFSIEERDVPRPTDDQDKKLKEKERDSEAGVKRTKKGKAAIQTPIAVTDCENESKIPRLSRVHRCKDCQHEHVDTSDLSEKHLKETHANQQQGRHEHNNLKTSISCAMKRKSVKIKDADIMQESKNRRNGSDHYPKDDTISPCGVCSSQPSYKEAAKVVEPSEMNKPAEKHGERLKPCMNNDTVSSKVQDSADNIFGTQKSKCKNHTDGKLFRSTFSCKDNSHEESTTCDLPELDSEIDLQRQQDRIDDTPRFLQTQPNTNKESPHPNKESPHPNKALENTIPRNDYQQVKRNIFACKIQRKYEIKSSVNAGPDINEDEHTTAPLLGEYCRKKHNDSTSRGNFVEPTHIGNKQMKQHEREQEILNRSTTEGRNVVQSSTSSIDSKIESRTSQLPNAHRCQGCKNDEADFLTHHEPHLHKGYISNRNQPKITHEQEKSKVSIFCAMKKKLMKCKDVDNTWKCEGSRHDKRDNHKKDSRVKSPCRICRSKPSSSVKTASPESSDVVDVTKETASLESSDVDDVTKETASLESSDVDDVTKETASLESSDVVDVTEVTPESSKKKETSLTEKQLSSQVKETVGIIYAMSNSKFKDTTDCRLFGGTFGCKDSTQEESTACKLPDLDSEMSDTRGQQNVIQGLSEFFCSQTIEHKDYDNPSCYESESGPNCFSKCFPAHCQNSVLQCSCCPNLQGNDTNDRSDCSCTNLGHHLLVCRPCSRQFGHNHCLCRGTQQTHLKKPSNKCVVSDQCVAFQYCSLKNCRFGCYFIVKSNSNNTKNSQNMTVSYLDSEEASLTKSRSSLNATRAEQVSLPRTDFTEYRHYFECADSEYKQQTPPTYRAYSGHIFHEFYPLNSSKMETSANVHSQGNEYSAKGERVEQGERVTTNRILIGSNRVCLCLERGCMHNSHRRANNAKESPQVLNPNLREPAQEKLSINTSDHTNSKKKEIGCTVNHISKRSQTDRGQTICNENNPNKHEVVITISNHGNQSHSEPNNNVSDHIEREVSNNVGLHSKPCKRELSNSMSNESYSRRQELSNNVSQDSNPSTREQSCRISIDNSRSDRELSATVINDNIQKEKELHSSASNVSDACKKELRNTASNDTNITKRELSNIMCNSIQRTEREASTISSNYRNRKRKENVNSPSNYSIIDNRDLNDTVTNQKNEELNNIVTSDSLPDKQEECNEVSNYSEKREGNNNIYMVGKLNKRDIHNTVFYDGKLNQKEFNNAVSNESNFSEQDVSKSINYDRSSSKKEITTTVSKHKSMRHRGPSYTELNNEGRSHRDPSYVGYNHVVRSQKGPNYAESSHDVRSQKCSSYADSSHDVRSQKGPSYVDSSHDVRSQKGPSHTDSSHDARRHRCQGYLDPNHKKRKQKYPSDIVPNHNDQKCKDPRYIQPDFKGLSQKDLSDADPNHNHGKHVDPCYGQPYIKNRKHTNPSIADPSYGERTYKDPNDAGPNHIDRKHKDPSGEDTDHKHQEHKYACDDDPNNNYTKHKDPCFAQPYRKHRKHNNLSDAGPNHKDRKHEDQNDAESSDHKDRKHSDRNDAASNINDQKHNYPSEDDPYHNYRKHGDPCYAEAYHEERKHVNPSDAAPDHKDQKYKDPNGADPYHKYRKLKSSSEPDPNHNYRNHVDSSDADPKHNYQKHTDSREANPNHNCRKQKDSSEADPNHNYRKHTDSSEADPNHNYRSHKASDGAGPNHNYHKHKDQSDADPKQIENEHGVPSHVGFTQKDLAHSDEDGTEHMESGRAQSSHDERKQEGCTLGYSVSLSDAGKMKHETLSTIKCKVEKSMCSVQTETNILPFQTNSVHKTKASSSPREPGTKGMAAYDRPCSNCHCRKKQNRKLEDISNEKNRKSTNDVEPNYTDRKYKAQINEDTNHKHQINKFPSDEDPNHKYRKQTDPNYAELVNRDLKHKDSSDADSNSTDGKHKDLSDTDRNHKDKKNKDPRDADPNHKDLQHKDSCVADLNNKDKKHKDSREAVPNHSYHKHKNPSDANLSHLEGKHRGPDDVDFIQNDLTPRGADGSGQGVSNRAQSSDNEKKHEGCTLSYSISLSDTGKMLRETLSTIKCKVEKSMCSVQTETSILPSQTNSVNETEASSISQAPCRTEISKYDRPCSICCCEKTRKRKFFENSDNENSVISKKHKAVRKERCQIHEGPCFNCASTKVMETVEQESNHPAVGIVHENKSSSTCQSMSESQGFPSKTFATSAPQKRKRKHQTNITNACKWQPNEIYPNFHSPDNSHLQASSNSLCQDKGKPCSSRNRSPEVFSNSFDSSDAFNGYPKWQTEESLPEPGSQCQSLSYQRDDYIGVDPKQPSPSVCPSSSQCVDNKSKESPESSHRASSSTNSFTCSNRLCYQKPCQSCGQKKGFLGRRKNCCETSSTSTV